MKLLPNKKLNTSELFVCERILELIHTNTIDSYRARVMNTKLIIKELVHLCEGWIAGKVYDFRTVTACLDETKSLIKDDDVFVWNTVSKGFFLEFIEKAVKASSKDLENPAIKSKDTPIIENFTKIKRIIQTILTENIDYSTNLLNKIQFYIDNPVDKKDPYLTFLEMDKYIGLLITELISKGYHKSYLSNLFNTILLKGDTNFDKVKSEISYLIRGKEKKYQVWFKLHASESICKSLSTIPNFKVSETITLVPPTKQPVLSEYHKVNKPTSFSRFIAIDINAFDYFSALHKAKTIIAEGLDIINLGFGNENLTVVDRAYVVDCYYPELGRFREVRYILDGHYNYGEPLFTSIQTTISTLLDENYIEQDSKEKIKSAFHYLRLGNEALEIEHKIINYWFGLEYLFSNPTDTSFKRIVNFFPKLQAISYIKRNVVDLYDRAKELHSKIPLKHISLPDYSCLNKSEFYDEIKDRDDVYKASPLLSYRAWYFKNRCFTNSDKRIEVIKSHMTKLEQQLRRIYFVRNEIVHEARYNTSNESITSNLKYYLIFSVSVILDYLLNYKPATNEKISIEDFLHLRELQYEYLEKEDFPMDKILNVSTNHNLLGA